MDKTNTNTTELNANSFERTLREMRHGRLLAELSMELPRLIEAVEQTGKGGELILKLKCKPTSAGDAVTVSFDDDVTLKLPRPNRGSTIFFIGANHTLQRTDPRQREFVIKEVGAPVQAGAAAKAS